MAETTAGRMQTDLKPNSLGLVGVTMQAITHIAPAIAALFFTQFLVTLAGVTAPLAYVVAVAVVAVATFQYIGIELSARTLLITGGIEILIVIALAITGFANPGPGGFSFAVFNPGNIGNNTSTFGIAGFTLGIILAVQGLTGWEAAAPLAEETQDPKKNTPRSVLLSIVILGVFLVFTYWGVITGFGVDNIKGIQGSADLPGLALAHDKWGAGWWLILLAFLSSTFAVTLATANVSTRMWYALGRNGAFPKLFAKVHPTHKTPTNAIYA